MSCIINIEGFRFSFVFVDKVKSYPIVMHSKISPIYEL